MRTFIVRYTVQLTDGTQLENIWRDADGQTFRFTTVTKAVNWLDRNPAMTAHFVAVSIVPE